MTRRLTFVSFLVALAVLAGGITPASAAPASAPLLDAVGAPMVSTHPLEYLLEAGWQAVAPDVLRRDLGNGRTETFATGVRGLRWAVRHLLEELAVMERDYELAPTDALWDAIQTHRQLLVETRGRLHDATLEKSARIDPLAAAIVPGCNFNWGYWADARPGAQASASASWYNTCGYLAYTYAYAYVSTTVGTVTTTKSQSDPKGPGTNLSSYASASLSGTANSCYSYARAYVDSYDFGFFQATDVDYNCNPLVVSINGLSYIYVYSGCKTVTWTASPSGGSGVYTNYAWTYNGSAVGSNSSSYSRTFCAGTFYRYYTFSLGVTVTDSANAHASDSRSVTVELDPIGDPCLEPQSGQVGSQQQALPPCP